MLLKMKAPKVSIFQDVSKQDWFSSVLSPANLKKMSDCHLLIKSVNLLRFTSWKTAPRHSSSR